LRFVVKPGKKETFYRKLLEIVNKMKDEEAFIDCTILQDVDHSEEMIMYETWKGTRETWLLSEAPRSYRSEYEDVLPALLESLSVAWLTPLQQF
jgi:quinol monooxygenase YgiN